MTSISEYIKASQIKPGKKKQFGLSDSDRKALAEAPDREKAKLIISQRHSVDLNWEPVGSSGREYMAGHKVYSKAELDATKPPIVNFNAIPTDSNRPIPAAQALQELNKRNVTIPHRKNVGKEST